MSEASHPHLAKGTAEARRRRTYLMMQQPQVTWQVSEEVKLLLAIARKEIQFAPALRGRENFEARYSKAANISCRLPSGVHTRPRLSCLRISPADNYDAGDVIAIRLQRALPMAGGAWRNAYRKSSG